MDRTDVITMLARRAQDFQLTWPLLDDEMPRRTTRTTLPACSGACEQGRRLCVTPEACRLVDDEDADDDPHAGFGAIAVPVLGGLSFIAVMLAIHLIFKSMT